MSECRDVLIVGAGQAGAQAAISLRQRDPEAAIRIVGEEAELPYERPPLSKKYLAGEFERDRLLLKRPSFWTDRGISLRTGVRVTAIDPANRAAITATGETLRYTTLVWAAGGVPRMMSCPGADLAGIHVVRTREQADRLRAHASRAHRAVIIGGGFVGLETAATLTGLGLRATVIEAAPRLLARVAGSTVSDFYADLHRRNGVEIITAAAVEAIEGDGAVRAVKLRDGTVLPADLVVVGIGLVPGVEVLERAGARCTNGVDVDAFGQTSLPDVYAIGDCAHYLSPWMGDRPVRLESVQNAVDQAKAVAATVTGTPTRFDALPWFWSDQYETRLQTVGLTGGHTEEVVRGDPATGSFSVLYLRDGRPCAIDAINRTHDFIAGKALLRDAASAAMPIPHDVTTATNIPTTDAQETST